MALGRHRRAVGVFSQRKDAELALRELRDSNFPMDRVSVITRDANSRDDIAGTGTRNEVHERTEGNKADEGATTGAIAGGTLGGITGLLVGLGTLAIPGIGPIMLAGAAATALATTLAGTAIGAAAGGLLGALIGLGIPEERARVYNDRISRGHYLIVVEGTDDDIARAEGILHNRGIEEWGVYDRPDGDVPHYATATTPRSALVHNKRAVGVFPHRRDAEVAIRDLRDAGFPMSQVSLVGPNTDPNEHVAGIDTSHRHTGNQADEGAKAGAATGATLGGLGGLLVGLGALAIPGVGPVIAGGTLATALATALAGGAIGAAAGGLTGALVGLGIPDDRARFYNDRVARGDYLVMVDGTEDEIRRAEAILRRHRIEDWDVFDVPNRDRTHHATSAVDTDRRHYAVAATPHRDRGHYRRAVGVFPHHRDAEAAIQELNHSGFPMSQVSLVGRDTKNNAHIGDVTDRTKTDEGAKGGAAAGAALGGLGGLLVGLGALAIPGIGPVIAGGALATALATAAAGGAIGAAAGGLTGALVGLGIPDDRARYYNDRVNRGDYLVMVDGTDDEIARAEAILRRRGIQDWDVFDAPSGDRDHTHHTHHSAVATSSTPARGTTLSHRKYAVGVFPSHRDTEHALNDLRDAGVPMNQVSIIATDAHRHPSFAGINPLNRIDNYAHYGIFDDRARLYGDRLHRGNYLVMVHGTDDELRRAEAILNRRGIQDFGIYDPNQVTATRQVIEPDTTSGVNTISQDATVIKNDPEVIIIDHRDQTL